MGDDIRVFPVYMVPKGYGSILVCYYTTTLCDSKLSAKNGYIRRQFKRLFYQDLSQLRIT